MPTTKQLGLDVGGAGSIIEIIILLTLEWNTEAEYLCKM